MDRTRWLAGGVVALQVLGALLVILAVTGLPASAGDSADPEVVDDQGDSVSGAATRDIVSAFLGNEDAGSIEAWVYVSQLEQYTPPNQWQNLPKTELELYFTVKEKKYAAAAVVPVHGPGGSSVSYELRQVDDSTDPPTETLLTTVQGQYRLQDNAVEITIPLDSLGKPVVGDIATNVWAASYYATFQGTGYGDRTQDDRGPNDGYGRNYAFITPGDAVLDLRMDSANTTGKATLTTPAYYTVHLRNNGTVALNVTLALNTVKNWKVSITNGVAFVMNPGDNRNASMMVTLNRTAKNGEVAEHTVTAVGSYGNQSAPTKTLRFQTTASLPGTVTCTNPGDCPGPGPGGWLDLIVKNILYIALVAAVAAIGGGSYLMWSSKRRGAGSGMYVEFEDVAPAGAGGRMAPMPGRPGVLPAGRPGALAQGPGPLAGVPRPGVLAPPPPRAAPSAVPTAASPRPATPATALAKPVVRPTVRPSRP